MKLCVGLFLLLSISIASALRCYTCTLADPRSCIDTKSCPVFFDRCFSLRTEALVTKGCQNSIACLGPMDCCEGNLCNGALHVTGSGLVLLLLSSTAITFLF